MATEPTPIVAVVGATATGKSALALELAERLGGEIVNADAMQLYRGMDIGTAKLPMGERRGIRHYQLDVLDVRDEASVAVYQRDSRVDLDAIAARRLVPVLVGGSGLYVRAALDALDIPPTAPAVRARWEAYAAERGVAAAHQRLAKVDPIAAQHILPTNARRVVRALEVNELTGAPFTAALPERVYRRATMVIGLRLDRTVLDERIGRRTEQMWADGLVDEVAGLVGEGLRAGRTARTAIGYSQALAQLDGELTAAEAIAATTMATRRFVRRQESWFRPDARITWLDASTPDLLDQALAVVAAAN
ncbi:tRNA (adenosine(37)-N6)-dimethylallyltransferase MiaA [Nostocoides vanveenii]|uniref:tRNA dimethylallyltransferase n=1 Tax=Nostocoides vanveenii TaxID=330835 RepID=A0ABP4WKD4_9MICO